jgi:translation initiation factor IF-3
MLLKQKQVSDLISGDIIFGVEVVGNDVRYKLCRVVSFTSENDSIQVSVMQKPLEATVDEVGKESELVLFKNQPIMVVNSSMAAFMGWFTLGIMTSAIIFGLTYQYFLNCQ